MTPGAERAVLAISAEFSLGIRSLAAAAEIISEETHDHEMLGMLKELLSLDTLSMHVIGDSYPDCPDCKLVEKASKLIAKVEAQ